MWMICGEMCEVVYTEDSLRFTFKAHRLSTIKECDRIIVLDKGEIIEDGKYDELIGENGYFASLVSKQRLDG